MDFAEYLNLINFSKVQKYAEDNNLFWLIKSLRPELINLGNYKRISSIKKVKIENINTYTILRLHRDKNSTILAIIYKDYLSIGPTFHSADGEYRSKFITISLFNKMYDTYSSFFTDLLVYLRSELENKNIYVNQIGEKIDEYMIEKIIVIAISLIFLYMKYDHVPNHININFIPTLMNEKIKQLCQQIWNLKKIEEARFILRFSRYESIEDLNIELGQKISTITISEAENAGNINYKLWREVYINKMVSNLVLNGITPSFPIFINWSFINIRPEIFDNHIHHIRIENSKTVFKIVQKLEQLRSKTYVLSPLKKSEIFLNLNMGRLSQHIEIPIDFAEKNIILSHYGSLLISEHVGSTFADIIKFTKKENVNLPIRHYIFEYIYSLYAMNIKLNVVHADLHLNNITFYLINVPEQLRKNSYILYNVEDKYYLFPYSQFIPCIIDFSRSIIGNKIDAVERSIIMQVWEQNLPEFHKKYEKELFLSLFTYPAESFNIFMAIDAYRFINSLIFFFQEMQILDHMELLEKIKDITITYLMKYSLKPTKVDNPNLVIIRECFSEEEISHFNSEVNIVDYFSTNNEIKNTIEFNETFEKLKSQIPSKEERRKMKIYKTPKKIKKYAKELETLFNST
ncbi:MAG: hypothetical protein QW303_03195 [Nitrososphaerota archaeon]